ncbi:MAG: PDZ domain-containing protein [Proteobacteria bacterium]|nr:PDZ domain-containing protein [Pseudomonadota bacterium]
MGEKLIIARIMHGGLIHRQGLLKVGDVVKEVNGEVVSSMQPVELQAMLVRRSVFIVDTIMI